MIRKLAILCLVLLLSGGLFSSHESAAQSNQQLSGPAKAFWEKFRAAVIRGDKTTVAALSDFRSQCPTAWGGYDPGLS